MFFTSGGLVVRPLQKVRSIDPHAVPVSSRGLAVGSGVLVVDSSEGVRWTLREAFGARGIPSVHAKSVWASRIFLKQHSVRLVIAGVSLADGSGLELLSSTNVHGTPLFLMSGYPYNREGLIAAGAVDFFLKPFDVLRAVDRMLSETSTSSTDVDFGRSRSDRM